jgi:hypothetical protein
VQKEARIRIQRRREGSEGAMRIYILYHKTG